MKYEIPWLQIFVFVFVIQNDKKGSLLYKIRPTVRTKNSKFEVEICHP